MALTPRCGDLAVAVNSAAAYDVPRSRLLSDLRAAGGITYLHFDGAVLYPFGHGLSYTTFSYKWSGAPPMPEHAHGVSTDLSIPYAVNVTNTGKVASDCVVLAFTVATAGSHALLPKKKLFDFARLLAMKPGEWRMLHFVLGMAALSLTGEGGGAVPALGRIAVEIGDVGDPLRHELRRVAR